MSDLLIKICGVTHEEHIAAASEEGANLVGVVLWPGSPRHVPRDRALQLANVARSRRLESVALVVDSDPSLAADFVHFDRVQFHGRQVCADLAGCPRPTIRGFAFSPETLRTWLDCPHAEWLIVDSPRGGSGEPFPYETLLALRDAITKPWLLAGGLTPETVASAITRVQPGGVDVSSGVEQTRGVKDPERIRSFCRAVRGM